MTPVVLLDPEQYALSSCACSASVSSRSAARYFSAEVPTDESSSHTATQTAAMVAPSKRRSGTATAW